MAGMSPDDRGRRQARRRRRDHRREIRVERAVLGGRRQEGRRVADRRVDLGPVAHDPGVGHQPRPVGVVEARPRPRVEPAERRAERLALAQDRRPRQAGLERLEGEPLEQLDVVVDGHAPFVVVVARPSAGPGSGRSAPAQAAPRPRVVDHAAHDSPASRDRRGVEAACSEASGRPAGRRALKTARKTSPETVFVPSEPMSVTLTSRPETPRSREVEGRRGRRRSSAGRPRTSADSCVRVYVLRRPRRVRRRSVVGGAVGAPVDRAAQVAHRPGDPLAGRRRVDVLVVLGRAAAGRVEQRVGDRRAARAGRGRPWRRSRRRRGRFSAERRRGRPASACRRRRRSTRRRAGAGGPRTSGRRSPAPGAPRPARSTASRPARRRAGRARGHVVDHADARLGRLGETPEDAAVAVVRRRLRPELEPAVGVGRRGRERLGRGGASAGRRRRVASTRSRHASGPRPR